MYHTPWSEAIEAMYSLGQRRSAIHSVGLSVALHSVLAENVYSPIELPHYSSSAMDGYAFSGQPPWKLVEPTIGDRHENRHQKTVPVENGQATPILTGGLLPEGADAVIRLEHTEERQRDGATWVFPTVAAPAPGSDIRLAGEELAAQSLIASAGDTLSPRLLAFLAVCGLDTLPVYVKPRVAVAYTGNEVITEGVPVAGEVRDAYSVQFPDIISALGAEVAATTRLHDDEEELESWFSSSATQNVDMLIITGGSSTSEVDLIRQLLSRHEARYVFEAVAVRPGHPCLCAVLPDQRIVLGLPGNPLAAHTSLYSYLPSYVAGRTRTPLPARPTARLTKDIAGFKKKDIRLIPSLAVSGEVTPLLDKSKSHMLSAFARANALVVVPPDGFKAGEQAAVLYLQI